MRIVLVVEAVPDPKQVRISQSQGIAVTAGADIIAGAGSRDALAVACDLREAGGGEIVALGAGKPEVEDALRQVMAGGADAAVLCADPALGELDAAATAAVLAAALRRLQPFDLVLAGSGELAPRLAEALDLPQITWAAGVTLTGSTVRALRPMDNTWEEIEVDLPAVVSVAPDPLRPPAPVTGIVAAYREKPLTAWSPADLGLSPDEVQPVLEVRRTFAASQVKDKIEAAPEEAARQLVQRLRAGGWL